MRRLSPLPRLSICAKSIQEGDSVHTADTIALPKAQMLQATPQAAKVNAPSAKRILDVTLALAGLVVLAPVLALVAFAIWLESGGPVLFQQQRTGLNGRIITVLKFRSMDEWAKWQPLRQATRGDSRVTRVGAFIRRKSLDELPQLINVIRGDMSLVGPRPHAVEHDLQFEAAIPQYAQRFAVRPGITGWAQVNGHRGEMSPSSGMEDRLRFDLEYIANQSLALDFRIILLTVLRTPFDPEAY